MPQVPEPDASKMQMGEVAKLTALSVDAIRFYERRTLLPKAPRTAGRFRLYSHEDVAQLGFIRQMQGLGFSLSEIRQLSGLREHRSEACSEVKTLPMAKLKNVRSNLESWNSSSVSWLLIYAHAIRS